MSKVYALLLASALIFAMSTATIARPAPKVVDKPVAVETQTNCKEAVVDQQAPCKKKLSEEQVAKIREVMGKYAPELEQLKDSLFVKKEVLRALQSSSSPDVMQVEAVATEIVSLKKQMRELRKKIKEEIGFPCPRNMLKHEREVE